MWTSCHFPPASVPLALWGHVVNLHRQQFRTLMQHFEKVDLLVNHGKVPTETRARINVEAVLHHVSPSWHLIEKQIVLLSGNCESIRGIYSIVTPFSTARPKNRKIDQLFQQQNCMFWEQIGDGAPLPEPLVGIRWNTIPDPHLLVRKVPVRTAPRQLFPTPYTEGTPTCKSFSTQVTFSCEWTSKVTLKKLETSTKMPWLVFIARKRVFQESS